MPVRAAKLDGGFRNDNIVHTSYLHTHILTHSKRWHSVSKVPKMSHLKLPGLDILGSTVKISKCFAGCCLLLNLPKYLNSGLFTHSPNDHLDFFENFNFHVLMFLKVYKHVFTRVRLCSGKKIHINITHIALMLI